MFIKKGDLIKVNPKLPEDYPPYPMVMVEAIVGDEVTVYALGDCAIVTTEGYVIGLADYDIVWVNGREVPKSKHSMLK